MSGPLTGYRIIELAGIGPGPYAGQLFADMGADVICIQRPDAGAVIGTRAPNLNNRGSSPL